MNLLFFPESPFRVKLSFESVIKELEETAGESGYYHGDKAGLLEEIASAPELRDGISNTLHIQKNADLIRRLMAPYFPPALTRNEIKAITIPYSGLVFNHSQRFLSILNASGSVFDFGIRDLDDHQSYVLSCCLILNEYYQTRLNFQKPLFYDIPTANGVVRHYKVLYNADFLDIFPTERSVDISREDIELLIDNYDNLDLWKEKFPENSWELRGFAIMSLIDVTIENAVSILKERLLKSGSDGFEEGVESVFQSVFNDPDIKAGFTLYNPDNRNFSIAVFGQPMRSFIMQGTAPMVAEDALCCHSYASIFKKGKYFAVSDTEELLTKEPENHLVRQLLTTGIQSFILAPVIRDGVTLGVLEVTSRKKNELNSINAHKLDVVMPYITDNIKRLISDLQNQVQILIQEKYTTIHPSVYWKFKAEAQKFIYDQRLGKETTLREIAFKDVYPLYGQVDIKGSSYTRNINLQRDLQLQIESALGLMAAVDAGSSALFTAEEKEHLDAFLREVSQSLHASAEQEINDYLEKHIHNKLKLIDEPGQQVLIGEYFEQTRKKEGRFHQFRRQYEESVSAINDRMSTIIDAAQTEAQSQFPHYFERFKTDGVEHNLYIGSSIAPDVPFTISRLHNLRFWQVRTLCIMAQAHYQLKPSLPCPMDITSLILVYNSPISIRFRMDEKRFDVDGSYNARFEIVKKRIDKAYVKNTHERITRPGKLTIVYSGLQEEAEYIGYVEELSKQGFFEPGIERLEVEDLQGVAGLKALRIKIRY